MKQILVPVDLSALSEKAYRLAADVASQLQMGITLLHVVPASGEILVDVTGNLIETEDFDTSAIKAKIADSCSTLAVWKTWYPQLSVQPKTRPGQAEEVILNELKQSDSYELIVMATHGATGMKEFFIGSHTEHIAMKSNVPLLSIKDTAKDLSRVVFASSFSGVMPVPAFFGKLCEALKADVTFLHVHTPSEATNRSMIEANMGKTAAACGIKLGSKVIFDAQNVEEGIENFTTAHKAGLLVLESKGRTGLSRWVAGCVSADLINHYEHALLTYKRPG